MMRDSIEEILISFPYNSKRFTRFFRKVLDCSHECVSTCEREEFIQEVQVNETIFWPFPLERMGIKPCKLYEGANL